MISCLNNFIGIQNVAGYENPDSGKFVNGLPGITTDILEDVSTTDDYTIQRAWEDILERATTGLEDDLNTWGAQYMLNYSYVHGNATGQYDDNAARSTSNNYNGWYFDFFDLSRNLTLQIDSVELYTSNEVSSTIRIFNGTTGDLLDTVDFTSTAGQINQIYVAKEYPLWRYPHIFVCYDENTIQTIDTSTLRIGEFDYVSNKSVGTGTTPSADNLIGANGSGLIVNYNMVCSWDNFVCQRRQLFLGAWWYKLGVEFCNERLFSDRINRYTLLNRDEATQLREELDAEYQKRIKAVLKGLKMNENDFCFVCNKAVNYRTVLP